jgi:hypothetical protein
MTDNGALHRLPVGDISDNRRQILMADGKLTRGANEGSHSMAFCQRRRDKDAPRRTRGAKDQQFHLCLLDGCWPGLRRR